LLGTEGVKAITFIGKVLATSTKGMDVLGAVEPTIGRVIAMAHVGYLDGVRTVAATNCTLNVVTTGCCLLAQLMAVEGSVGNCSTVDNGTLWVHKMVATLSTAMIPFRLHRETTLFDNTKKARTDAWNHHGGRRDLNSTQPLAVGTRRRRRILLSHQYFRHSSRICVGGAGEMIDHCGHQS
jgi:hypothetical protein